LVDTIAVGLPVWVRTPSEEVGDLFIGAPRARTNGNESRARTTGHGDLNLFPGFYPANQFGCVLSQFA